MQGVSAVGKDTHNDDLGMHSNAHVHERSRTFMTTSRMHIVGGVHEVHKSYLHFCMHPYVSWLFDNTT